MTPQQIKEQAQEGSTHYIEEDEFCSFDFVRCSEGHWYVWRGYWNYINPTVMAGCRDKLRMITPN